MYADQCKSDFPLQMTKSHCMDVKTTTVRRLLTISVFMFQTSIIPNLEDLDPDVLSTMNSLQCFKDKDKLIAELLNCR